MAFVLIGLGVALLGSMLGVGGGFLLVPLLLLLFQVPPVTAVGTSLAFVLVNGLAGTAVHWRRRRIDVAGALRFGLATIPGSVLGARLVSVLALPIFHLFLGAVLLAVAVMMLLRGPARRIPSRQVAVEMEGDGGAAAVAERVTPPERKGGSTAYLAGFGIGVLSSVTGIGGGVFQVPVLIYLLGYDAHRAAATSQLILVLTALTGTVMHLAHGNVDLPLAGTLAAGSLLGAPLGARLSQAVSPVLLTRMLAVCLAVVAFRVIIGQ